MIKPPSSGTTRLARRAASICLMCSLAACSSGKSHPAASSQATRPSTSTSSSTSSTSTTLPGPAKIAAVRAFFARDGKTLLAFERASAPLATGSAPTGQQCEQFTSTVFPKIVKDPNTLDPLARRIPDPALASAFSEDVRIKQLVGLGCSENFRRGIQPPSGTAADISTWRPVRDFAALVRRLLARYGIKI